MTKKVTDKAKRIRKINIYRENKIKNVFNFSPVTKYKKIDNIIINNNINIVINN